MDVTSMFTEYQATKKTVQNIKCFWCFSTNAKYMVIFVKIPICSKTIVKNERMQEPKRSADDKQFSKKSSDT
jgi:hypothetical protein